MTGRILKALSAREMETGPFSSESAAIDDTTWSHWKLGQGEDGIAWLLLDVKESDINVISEEVIAQLDNVLEHLRMRLPKAVVLRSAKDSNFCVGADIRQFSNLESESEVLDKLEAAHRVADALEQMPCPTIAVLHGQCLGGGLELALCCDFRFAVPGATLGLPEIQLGLHPGLQGTARLTHLIDPMEAMTLMLTGKPVDAVKAKGLGIVTDIVAERHVASAVSAAAHGEVERTETSMKSRLLTTRVARQFEVRQMRSKSAQKAPPEHYPAPEAMISLWEEHGSDVHAMKRAERESFARLLFTSTARNLIRVFFLREKMKGLSKSNLPTVRYVHIVGAGEMGGEIAGWCALQGLTVSLFDMNPEAIAKAVLNLAKLCDKKHLSNGQRREVLDRLVPDFQNQGVGRADLIIEAVPENVEIKQKVFKELEPKLKKGAIVASNTSSIPLQSLAEVLNDPSRLVGLHFFNPIAKMQLVEVVAQEKAGQETIERARGFVRRISRLPAPVSSAPGFLVNRALTPYLLEAMVLLDEGVRAETIDRVAKDFGMPMGPIELADQVGLDICVSVADMLQERLNTAMPKAPDWLRDKVENGDLGRKTGRGIYKWSSGSAQKQNHPPAAGEDTLDRLLLPMLNACMLCLREKVIEDEDILDGAMIFGTGFAPFRGGPMHYARTRGFEDIRQSLDSLTREYGPRFTPDPGWSDGPS